MIDWKLPLYKIFSDDEDLLLINKVIKRGNNWAIGPEIEEFENELKNYLGVEYCLVLNSGTSALHATLLSHGIGKNDQILLPSFSFISTANSVLFVNAQPKFIDIEETTFGLDPNLIQQSITSKTKAILPMDYGGMSCKIDELKKLAEENNLLLIEDAAESLGASINGKKVGTISNSAIFSFCGNKVLTTGEGGAVVTNSKEIFEKIKLIRSHGRVDLSNYFANPNESNYTMLGYNWRMSSITAALGISQLKKLNKLIKMRQENARYLSLHLSKFPDILVPQIPENYEHVFQMYSIRLKSQKLRDQLHDFLSMKKIFSKVYFHPIHKTDFYKKYLSTSLTLPVTEKVSETILTLPLYPNMLTEEKDYLVNSITEFFENQK
mgnify:CR=1 FL=1